MDTALLPGKLFVGDVLGGDALVANIVFPGAPNTTLVVTRRPGGRTLPITEDGTLPGLLMATPETSNQWQFFWRIFFGDTECTGCKSECALDIGPWEYRSDRPADFVACSSPTLYSDLPEGEHKFRVR